jgi:hypothetical protein
LITLHDWLDIWLQEKAREVEDTSFDKYKLVARELKERVAPDVAMAYVQLSVLIDYIHDTAVRTSTATANKRRKTVREIWKRAFERGKIPENIAEKLSALKSSKEEARKKLAQHENKGRRPFTLEEFETLLGSMEPADEWYGMSLLGLYGGQRLMDNAKADTKHIKDGVWQPFTGKTKKGRVVVLAAPVLKWLEEYGPKSGAIFPTLSKVSRKESAKLSNMFRRKLEKAGLVSRMPHRRRIRDEHEGTESKRVSELSYHSLRHTTQSWLSDAGVSRIISMAHVGHDDSRTSDRYTHVGVAALKRAVKKLPQVVGKKSA